MIAFLKANLHFSQKWMICILQSAISHVNNLASCKTWSHVMRKNELYDKTKSAIGILHKIKRHSFTYKQITNIKWIGFEIFAYHDKISLYKFGIIILNIGCYGYCCAPCMICSNASGLEENGGLYCLLACCCPIVGVFLLRQKAREKYGIEVKMAKTCVKDCGISI